MQNGLDIAIQLIDLLGKHSSKKRLQVSVEDIYPELVGGRPIATFKDEKTGILEILVSKKTLINIFKDCKQILDAGENCDDWKLYYASIGVLIMTPEDRRAVLLNETVLNKIILNDPCAADYHYNCLGALLSCDLAKTNKSASLWFYFRKVSVAKLEALDSSTLNEMVDLILLSVASHPRNYYACSFLRFLLGVCRCKGLLGILYERIWDYCKSHLHDFSMWLALLEILIGKSDYYLGELKRLGGELRGAPQYFEEPELTRLYEEIRLWGEQIGTPSYSLYYTKLQLGLHLGLDVCSQYKQEFEEFEQERDYLIDVSSRQLICKKKPVPLDNDALLKQKFEGMLIRKQLYIRYGPLATRENRI
ncbi:hypothetical protein KL910_001343 [Ogataea haglerorum]|nr:hypothetical protein KL945_003306 [Ogataea haglerorum]KAG7791962.1 hypothetical protein KL910_001343 [Ogataea haglerorum]